jgi:hypothetical protein
MHVILAVTIGRHKLFGGSTPPGWNHMPRLLLRACCTLLPWKDGHHTPCTLTHNGSPQAFGGREGGKDC